MASELFHVSDVNPNESVGGGGCACSEAKSEDCKPPYVVFYAQEMASNLSPHVVVCQRCIDAAQRKLQGEALAAGEVGASVDGEDPEAVLGKETPRG